MSSKQLTIPGMEHPVMPKPKKLTTQEQLGQLQRRLLWLELEVTLLQVRMEKGDEDYAEG